MRRVRKPLAVLAVLSRTRLPGLPLGLGQHSLGSCATLALSLDAASVMRGVCSWVPVGRGRLSCLDLAAGHISILASFPVTVGSLGVCSVG